MVAPALAGLESSLALFGGVIVFFIVMQYLRSCLFARRWLTLKEWLNER